MKSKILISISILAVASIGYYLYWYFFRNVYEIDYSLDLDRDNYFVGETVRIGILPLNTFGKVIKNKEVAFTFEIMNGKNCSKILKMENQLLVEFIDSGSLELKVMPEFALKPTLFSFNVSK